MTARIVATAFALAIGIGAAGSAAAVDFSVYPVQVELGAGQQTAILSLHNDSAQPLRLQVRAYAWSVGTDGKWQLAPTEDLIVNPQLFEIAPGQPAQLRVGTLLSPGPTERAWRLLLDELPDANEETGKGNVRVRMFTRINLPVFLKPAGNATPALKLASVQVRRDQLILTVRNDGNMRFDPQPLRVWVLDAGGRELFQASPTLGYLLPAAQMDIKLTLPARVCTAAATISISADSVSAGTVTVEHDVRVDKKSCAAASSLPAR